MTRRELERRQSRLFEQTLEAFEYPPSADAEWAPIHGAYSVTTDGGRKDDDG